MIFRLFWLFFKLGFLSIGGGYPMLSLIYSMGQTDVGLTGQEFKDMAALELLASGPIALNSSTYIGYIKAGIPGALIATLGVCLPSVILTTILAYFLTKFKDSKYMKKFIMGIKISCAGVLISTAFTLGKDAFMKADHVSLSNAEMFVQAVSWPTFLVFSVVFLALIKFKNGAVPMILVAAVLGVFIL